MVEKYAKELPFEDAVRKTLKDLRGIYSLVCLWAKDPEKLIGARIGPPSVIGLGDGEFFVGSDMPALLEHTRKIFFLADGDVAVLTGDGVRVRDLDGKPVDRPAHQVTWDPIMAEKGGYKHFMQKEIFEQPRAVRDTLVGRISQDAGKVFLEEMAITEKAFREFQNVRIVACGTSWHAGLAGKFMIERLARLPVEVDYGSEFRYRDPIIDSRTLTVCISQSGETADTLAAQREAKQKGSPSLAICNVKGSMITREAAGTLLTHARPEVGVASTKAFTAQLAALVVLATRDESDPASMPLYEKSVSNIKEVKARDGIVISVVTSGDHLAREASDHVIELPAAADLLSPMLEIIPLQLLAYYIAVRRGCDVDQPRNLAQSVTVE